MNQKIIIFGATGGTGRELLKQSLAEGHQVTAFVRNPDKLNITHENLSVFQGDVLNYDDVDTAVQDHTGVFCCLGMPASDKSELRTAGTLNIVKAMESNEIDRIICQTSLGFGDSEAVLPWHMKYLIVPFILKNAFKDHATQEMALENSNTDWTVVRPGNMTNGEKTGNYKYNFKPTEKIKLKISRADVADFMLKQLNSNEYKHQRVGISY